jgi:hypothetical protein
MMIGEKCPICGKEMEHYSDSLDGWMLLEESDDCPSGHYSYSYNTGVYVVTVGHKQIYWNYRTPFDRERRIHKLLARMTERYKLLEVKGT